MDQVESLKSKSLIRYKVYLMLVIVLVFLVMIGGLSFSKERNHSEVEGKIYMYHMESVYDLILIQKEIQTYQIQVLNNGRDVLPTGSDIRADTAYNLRQIWSAVIKRQQHYKGKSFNVVVDKATLQIEAFINILSKANDPGPHDDKQIMQRIQPLLFSIEQLERLHMVSRHILLERYERDNKNSLLHLAILGIALILSVLVLAYYVVRVIKKYTDC